MKTTAPPLSQSSVEQAIRILNEEEPSFGNAEWVHANRLIASLTAVECNQCNDEGKEEHPKHPGQMIQCRRCGGKLRGYRGRSVFWTGWARVTKGGVMG